MYEISNQSRTDYLRPGFFTRALLIGEHQETSGNHWKLFLVRHPNTDVFPNSLISPYEYLVEYYDAQTQKLYRLSLAPPRIVKALPKFDVSWSEKEDFGLRLGEAVSAIQSTDRAFSILSSAILRYHLKQNTALLKNHLEQSKSDPGIRDTDRITRENHLINNSIASSSWDRVHLHLLKTDTPEISRLAASLMENEYIASRSAQAGELLPATADMAEQLLKTARAALYT